MATEPLKISEIITASFLPLGAFWVSFNSLLAAAKFVNEIRDTILKESQASNEHRKALLLDWWLSMIGTIAAAFLYSGIIMWIAWFIKRFPETAYIWEAVAVVAIFPMLSGFLFIACSVSDYRLMTKVVARGKVITDIGTTSTGDGHAKENMNSLRL